MSRERSGGFTLLEVLVAMVILSVAVVTLIQLASQGLRLLKASSDHQEAALLADRVTRNADPNAEATASGQEGQFTWAWRARLVAVPDELTPAQGPRPRLLELSTTVKWGKGRSMELVTLRLAQGAPNLP
jgi:general secretion pathway protein I